MKSRLELRPAHKPVQNYDAALRQQALRVDGAPLSVFTSNLEKGGERWMQ
ncbi:MAG TPA: hypothetical protein VFT34_00810 [Verrucomicrobiae bacterium]|nr:hypothetical protein [Verrucomicrobiae bacterium]